MCAGEEEPVAGIEAAAEFGGVSGKIVLCERERAVLDESRGHFRHLAGLVRPVAVSREMQRGFQPFLLRRGEANEFILHRVEAQRAEQEAGVAAFGIKEKRGGHGRGADDPELRGAEEFDAVLQVGTTGSSLASARTFAGAGGATFSGWPPQVMR